MLSKVWLRRIGPVILCAAAIVVAIVLPDYQKAQVLPAVALAIASLGFSFQSRAAGDISLAYGLFFGIGSYAAIAASNAGWTVWTGILIGIVVSAVVSGLVSMATHRYRVRGVFYTFATLAVSIAVLNIFESTGFLGGVSGIIHTSPGGALGSLKIDKVYLLSASIVLLFLLGLGIVRLERSRFGILWRSIASNEDAAAGVGVDVRNLKIWAAVIGASIASIGGAVAGLNAGIVAPDASISWSIGVAILVGSVFGGLSHWWFAPAGTVLLTMIPDMVTTQFPSLPSNSTVIIYGVCLLIVMYGLADGVFGTIQKSIRSRRLRQTRAKAPVMTEGV